MNLYNKFYPKSLVFTMDMKPRIFVLWNSYKYLISLRKL